jgi:hypothetical protein
MKVKNLLIKIFISIWLQCYVVPAYSQITTIINQLNPYHFNSKDVWNLSFMSPMSGEIQVNLHATIFSASGSKLVELKSAVIKISKGVTQINSLSVQSELINYYDNYLMQREQQGLGLLPGNYKICVYLKCVYPDCNGLGSNAIARDDQICESIFVDSPTPLLLLFPEHKSEIDQTRPNLIWIPPSPISPSAPMTYWVTLSSKLENQNVNEAMRLNRPLFSIPVEQVNMLPFPQDLPPLIKGAEYVWQVEAKSNGSPVVVSEVWQFKIKKDEKKIIPKLFVKVNDVRSDYYPVEDTLRFTYIEDRFSTGNISYRILSENGGELKPYSKLPFNSGENRYMVNLIPLGLTDSQGYILEVLTPNNTLLPLKFIFYSSGN